MVEIFKTNVQCTEEAALLVQRLLEHFSFCSVNFDLEDCDRILRIEGDLVHAAGVITLLDSSGYSCEVLV